MIIGGGGHGLSTAYYLATRHGITNVAVIEADYIASGNTGRNTTIIRANYGLPEAIRFYQHSFEMYRDLEDEVGAAILHQTKGIFWLAHTEMALRTERARAAMNTACRREDRDGHPGRDQGARPAGRPDRRAAATRSSAPRTISRRATARHDRVAWAYAAGAAKRGVHVIQHTPVTGLVRDGDRVVGVETAAGSDRGGRRPVRGRRPGDAAGGPGRPPAAGPDAPAPRVRHERLSPRASGRSSPAPSSTATCHRPSAARCSSAPNSTRSPRTRASRRSRRCASYSHKITRILPFLRDLRILRHVGGHLRHLGRLLADHGLHRASTASSSRPAGEHGASRRSRPAARRWPS